MAWTTPITWNNNQLVTASDLNAQVRDNLNYLLSQQAVAKQVYVGGSNKTTTSTSFADVDSTNMKVTITPQSTRVKVVCHFTAGTSAQAVFFDINCSSPSGRFGDATNGMAGGYMATNHWTLEAYFTGLTPGVAVSFTLQWKVTVGGTGTLNNVNEPFVMEAYEI